MAECYSCGEEIARDDVRIVAQALEFCPTCYEEMHEVISEGYFDTEDMYADEIMAEKEMETHFSIFA